jgi:hypothetical protein
MFYTFFAVTMLAELGEGPALGFQFVVKGAKQVQSKARANRKCL